MRLGPLLIAGLVALGACSRDRQAEMEGPAVVTFTATDYAFTGPAEVPAGAVTIRLVNQGKEMHHAVLARLEEGKALDDVLRFYQEQNDPLLKHHPTFLTYLGGAGTGVPGSAHEATAVLEPGEYALICYLPAPDGTPHFSKGMTSTFRVTASEKPAPPPATDIDLVLRDFGFTLSKPLTAGTHTVHVRNEGPQIHDVELVRLEPGATADQFLRAMAPGSETPPPGQLMGGLGGISPGQSAYWTVSVEPGTYVLLCFVPDSGDGAPHFAHGMVQQVTVG